MCDFEMCGVPTTQAGNTFICNSFRRMQAHEEVYKQVAREGSDRSKRAGEFLGVTDTHNRTRLEAGVEREGHNVCARGLRRKQGQ